MKNEVFDQHPNLKGYHETSDGIKFHRAHDAKVHARALKDKSIKEVTNEDYQNPNDTAKKATLPKQKTKTDKLTPMQVAKLRAEAIATMKTVEEVNAVLKDETAKTVIAAGEERIKELEAAASKK